MESPFYGYYHMKTPAIEESWSTHDLRGFLVGDCGFTQDQGHFRHRGFFCRVELLNVKTYDSWSSRDYDSDKTNFVSITTAKKLPPEAQEFLARLGERLNAPLCDGHEGEVNQ